MSELQTVVPASDSQPIVALKPPIDPATLTYRQFDEGEFWRHVPKYADVDASTFLDHVWQMRNSVTKPKRLRDALGDRVPEAFYDDVDAGFRRAPMSMRVSPYLMARINWDDPYDDPLRRQFIPIGSRILPDHPKLDLDSLHEQADAPVPGLTHRYPDKALFLPLDTCPVYCRFCTRSYAVGIDTEEVAKVSLKVNAKRWRRAFDYIQMRPELEDIVISGGDAYQLRPEQLEYIGMTLLEIPHIQRLRYATKGIAIMPQKILTDDDWLDALTRVCDEARKRHKDVVVHTHFNSAREATWITRDAAHRMQDRGIVVRNQSVLQRGVNDTVDSMRELVKRIGHLQIQPYYVYLCDMVKGIEDLRTSVATAVRLEKHMRGSTAGFNTPTFVCDAPGGGGKREVHSYELYDQDAGIAVYTAPAVKARQFFMYFDPIHALSEEMQAAWTDPVQRQGLIMDALERAKECVID